MLKFIKEDAHFSRYYDAIYILFHTGLRISEFCGLTVSEIEFDEMRIKVDHQLQRTAQMKYVIEEPKTESGTLCADDRRSCSLFPQNHCQP